MMQIWLNGRKPPYMESCEPDMNPDKARHAVRSMTYEGMQMAAAGYLLAMNAVGQTPAQMTAMLEDAAVAADEKAGTRTPIRFPADQNNDDGPDAA